MTITLPPASVAPDYSNGNFAQLPDFIQALLRKQTHSLTPLLNGHTGDIDTIVFILADAFGWQYIERFSSHPALQRFQKDGGIHKLTAQFPSTTTAHVTTFGSGLPVSQHGMFEWQYYEPEMDAMIVPLLFTFSGERQPELLRQTGVDAQRIMPQQTYYQRLAQYGIQSTILMPASYLQSSFNRTMNQGARTLGYQTLPEALINLRRLIQKSKGPACYYFYHPDIDTTCHHYGPHATQTTAEVDAFLTLLDRNLLQKLPARGGRTLLLISADHGQTYVEPKRTIYLNQLPVFRKLEPLLQRNRQGDLLAPGGSPRDMFLYVKNEALDEAQSLLGEALAGRADIFRTQDMIDDGLFGPDPSPTFRARAGNLFILGRPHETVWWYEKDRFEQKYYGHHGGLSADEMEIPLLSLAA